MIKYDIDQETYESLHKKTNFKHTHSKRDPIIEL